MQQNDRSSHILSFRKWMPKDENHEIISDEDSQTECHIYHEDSPRRIDTESNDSENSTLEVNDESSQSLLSEIVLAEPIEASPQPVYLEDNITLRGDDDQPQTEPEEQLGRGIVIEDSQSNWMIMYFPITLKPTDCCHINRRSAEKKKVNERKR
ncbi:hypothetical protein JTB14_031893 [Gonioctena quinquepunctata]|nr:hypothetical protein JTB14_031893 [Gonioctena quinquepunctata]